MMTFPSPNALRVAGLAMACALIGSSAVADPAQAPTCAVASSRFWKQLDIVCTGASSLRTAVASMPEADQAVANQALAYCDSGAKPEFAALALGERHNAVRSLAAKAGVSPEQIGDPIEQGQPVTAVWVDRLARKIVSDESLSTGAAGDLLVNELVSRICTTDDVRAMLPATCSPAVGGGALLELRRRIILDVAALSRRLVERAAGPAIDAKTRVLLAQLAMVEALLNDAPLYSLATLLARQAGSAAAQDCASLQVGSAQGQKLATPVELAGVLLRRLLLDGAAFDVSRDHYLRVIENVLSEGAGRTPLSERRRAAAERLLQSLRSTRALEEQLARQPDADAFRALATNVADVLDALLTLVTDTASVVPPEIRALVLALADGRLGDAAETAARMPAVAGFAAAPSALIDAASVGARLAVARDEDEARRVLRRIVLGLGPWSEPFLFDINGDIPKLESNDFNVIGDLTLGYNAQKWGVVGNGAVHEYDLTTSDLITQTSNRDGTLEGWFTLEPSPVWRIEVRGLARAAYYDTTKINLRPGANVLADETSWMGRGALLVSARYQPGTRFAAGLWAGAGGQYESYSRVDVGAADVAVQQASTFDETSFSLLLNARLRVQYAIVPSILAARLRVDAERFAITRDSQAVQFDAAAGAFTVTAPAESATQTELQARLFLDADIAKAFGFVPSLNTGFDYFRLDAASGSRETVVPVFGAGVRRDVF